MRIPILELSLGMSSKTVVVGGELPWKIGQMSERGVFGCGCLSCRVPLSLMPSSDSAHHTSTQFRTRLIEIPPESRRSGDIRRSRHRSARVGGGEHCISRTLCCMHVAIYFFFRHVAAAEQRLPRWPILHGQMFRKDQSG